MMERVASKVAERSDGIEFFAISGEFSLKFKSNFNLPSDFNEKYTFLTYALVTW